MEGFKLISRATISCGNFVFGVMWTVEDHAGYGSIIWSLTWLFFEIGTDIVHVRTMEP